MTGDRGVFAQGRHVSRAEGPSDVSTNAERIARLEQLRAESLEGGGPVRVERQHAAGKLTARERLELLLDADSFVELDAFVTHRAAGFGPDEQRVLGDGVVTGHGTIDGRLVFVYSQDFTVFGGSLSEAYAEKICKIMDLAMKVGAPIVGLNDSGGARIQEGVASLGGYAEIFLRNVLASGVVPQISVILGPCAGRSGLLAGDHRLHRDGRGHELHVRDRAQRRPGRDARGRRRGRARRRGRPHRAQRRRASRGRRRGGGDGRPSAGSSPTCHRTTSPTRRSSRRATRATAWTSSSTRSSPTSPRSRMTCTTSCGASWTTATSSRSSRRGPRTSSSASPGSAGAPSASWRSSRRTCAGALDIDASVKAARFVRTCDAFNVPLVTFVDVPGFLPGVAQEHGGIIRHGAKLLYAYCEATVPKVTVITRKAYGGAYDVMSSKHIRGDFNFAWPSAEIAVMGAEGAVNIIFKDSIAGADDPDAERSPARRGLRGRVLESIRGRRARVHRRGHPPARDAAAAHPRPRGARRQAGHEPAQEAWQHPALMGAGRRRLCAKT